MIIYAAKNFIFILLEITLAKMKKMNFLIAPASFKECLNANQIAKIIKDAILSVFPDAFIKVIPMADGGEGTVETLINAQNGTFKYIEVHDPLLRKTTARFGIINENKTAIIEMAAASGIELISKSERNPLITSTYGTGELITAALDLGCRKIILGIGGSATNDAGVGALMALGVRFYDKKDHLLKNIGGNLSLIHRFENSLLDSRLSESEIIIACDVNNPLTGTEGASLVYSPQKGADLKTARKLDDHLKYFAALIRQSKGIDIEGIPGAGAAGGLGGGLLAFTNCKLVPGFEIVKEITQLEKYIEWADIIFTGEGQIDFMTKFGKTPAGIARIAKKYNKPVIAIAGSLGENYQELYEDGFKAIYPINDNPITIEESIRRAPELIYTTVVNIANTIKADSKICN